MNTQQIAKDLAAVEGGDGYIEYAEELDMKTSEEQQTRIENLMSIAASAASLASALYYRYHRR